MVVGMQINIEKDEDQDYVAPGGMFEKVCCIDSSNVLAWVQLFLKLS